MRSDYGRVYYQYDVRLLNNKKKNNEDVKRREMTTRFAG